MNNPEVLIPVYVVEADARKFLEFQKNYDLFNFLLDNKVFEVHSGSVTMHFDDMGRVRKVETNKILHFK